MSVRAAVVALLAGTALAVPASPVSAAACRSSTAVTVVVDFASLGGGEQTRCTGVDPPSGLAALRDAGFTPTRAAQQPGYFVCRIDGKPASDPCQRTSPANAYWSYWHAKRGGTWTYSDVGPADYDPPPGTVEGWAFGAGKPPTSRPPAPAPAAPSPSPTTAAAASKPPASAPSPAPVAAVPKRSAPAPAAATSVAATASSASPDPTPTPPPEPASPEAVEPTTPVASHGSTGGVVVAGLLVALLAGAGAAALVRRRREA
jgi:hypothetical protein